MINRTETVERACCCCDPKCACHCGCADGPCCGKCQNCSCCDS